MRILSIDEVLTNPEETTRCPLKVYQCTKIVEHGRHQQQALLLIHQQQKGKRSASDMDWFVV
jgi:hypothetical protein